jgi:hypothetical protein
MNPLPQILELPAARAETSTPWPRPRPLSRLAAPALDLNKCVPQGLAPLRDFCAAVAETIQAPPDAVAPLALALASVGTSRALEVELSPQWRETAPLWFAVLQEPGERKSALLSLLARPLHDWQANERDYLRHALAAHNERRKITEARLAGIRQKLSRATGPDVQTLEREALALSVQFENLPPLSAPELVTSDATPEALRDLMGRNGEKVALVSAEVDAGQLMGTRYAKGGGANLDLLLKAFTGDPSPCHRIGKDIPLARPALALALCVQPVAVVEVLRDAYAKDRGLVPRLCVVSPVSRMGARSLHPTPVPPALLQWWSDTLRRLLDLRWPGRVILTPDGPTRHEGPPHVMRLTPDAVAAFDAIRLDLESRIGEGGDLRPVCGFVSKLPGVVARIALALEAMQSPSAEYIRAETMRAAVAWAPVLLAHFRAVLGDAAEGDDVKLARRLLAAIKRHDLAELSARDAHRLLDTGTGLTADEVRDALDVLTDSEWLRELPTPLADLRSNGGRPPSTRYTVNPAALE